MRNPSSPIKATQYASKIKLIDSHVNKGNFLQILVNEEYEQIFKTMSLKLIAQPPQQIVPFVAKNVLFQTSEPRFFVIRQQIAPKGKNYILNINAHGHIKLQIKVNERPSKFFSFQGNKAVQIYESSFNEVNITASMQKKGIFRQVKFYLDLIQIQFISRTRVNGHLKPNIDKQLDDYLANMRGKTAQILKNRSLTRSKQILSRKSLTNFRPASKNLEIVRSKSQFQTFQKKKSLYIQHVRKMSPERIKVFHENKQKYYTQKKQQMFKLSVLVFIAKLGLKIQEARVKQAAAKLKKMKVTMLCVDFIKIIKNKFRLKITQKARLRMCLHHTMQFIPLLQRKTTIKQAKQVLLESLTPFMDYRMIEEMGKYSQGYLSSALTIQKYFKKKSNQLRQRTQILMEKIVQIHKIDCLPSHKKKAIEKYLKMCLKDGGKITKLFSKREELIFLLRKGSLS